jgi:hypothetical protein
MLLAGTENFILSPPVASFNAKVPVAVTAVACIATTLVTSDVVTITPLVAPVKNFDVILLAI